MRISALRIAGFGPFRGEQRIDFDQFAGDGVFLISGKTGSGKSSVLDAIVFALYGSVPRYEGQSAHGIRSHHAAPDDPSYVELEFELGATKYLVRREPEYERPKRRGAGTTKHNAAAQLSQSVDGQWHGIAAKPVDVAKALAEVLPLSRAQFLQVVLLAQNRFQEFLHASTGDRQAVLRALFATDRFKRLTSNLADARREAVAAAESASADVTRITREIEDLAPADGADGHADASRLSLAEAERRRDLATTAAAHAAEETALTAAAQQRAEAALGESKRVQELQSRRKRLLDEQARLEAEAETVEVARHQLARSRAAAPLESELQLSASTAAKLSRLSTARADATNELLGHLRTAPYASDLDQLQQDDAPAELADESARVLGTLEELLRLEQALPGERTALERLRSARGANGAQLENITAELALLPERRATLHERITGGEVQAAALPGAEEQLARSTQLIAVSTERTTLAAEQLAALERSARLAELATTESAAERTLIARRLASSALVLAQELTHEAPCPVCGSREHPAPAAGDGIEDVSDAALARARASAAKASEAHSEAQLTLAALVQRAGVLDARLEGRSPEELEAALLEAKRRVGLARDAEKALAQHRTQLGDLEASERAMLEEQTKARSHDGELAAEISALEARLTADATRVETGLGGFDSIAARARHVGRTRELAGALLGLTRDLEAAQHDAEDAEARISAALEDSPFADREAATAALLPKATAAQLDARIRTHEQATASAASALAELTLQHVPAEPADVAAAAEARTAAGRTHDAQVATQTRLEGLAARLGELVKRLAKELATSEELFARAETLRVLAGTLSGQEPNEKRMSLEAYVLAAELEEIVAAANAQLARMTAGRYSLEHDDGLQYRGAQSGLGLRIVDAYTGRSRATESLSGGETFLASLALALGLAETVTSRAGGVRLDTLFIDEGFGSLDGETLGTAMATLDRLRSGGRTIGVISHVEAMQEQITSKLQVTADAHGESRVDARTS